MPYKDPEARKAYHKEYREKNKEKIKEQDKEYYEQNKEYNKEYYKEYREKHKEYNKAYHKEYIQTDAGKKSHRITSWKQAGVISDDIHSLYEHYINCKNCEVCDVELVEGLYGANKRCLDHSHTTGLFRNVLCHSCNIRRGENNI